MPDERGPSPRLRLLLGIGTALLALGLLKGMGEWRPALEAYICLCRALPLPAGMAPVGLALLGGVLGAGAVAGTVGLGRGLVRAWALARWVERRRVDPPPWVGVLARRVGLEGSLRCVALPSPQAFTLGVVRPSVYLSVGLVERLNPQALEAVLWHERVHLRRRDPLRFLLAEGVAWACFFLPLASTWAQRYLLTREREADREAIRRVGRRALVEALLALLPAPSGLPGLTPMAARVRWLLDPEAAFLPPIPWGREVPRLLVALGLLLLGAAGLGSLAVNGLGVFCPV